MFESPEGRDKTQVFFFVFTLVSGPRRSLSLKLSDARVYELQIRAHLVTTAHFCEVVVLKLRAGRRYNETTAAGEAEGDAPEEPGTVSTATVGEVPHPAPPILSWDITSCKVTAVILYGVVPHVGAPVRRLGPQILCRANREHLKRFSGL